MKKNINRTMLLLLGSMVFGANVFAYDYGPEVFVITVDSTKPGSSGEGAFTIPIHPDYSYVYEIDCDDDGAFKYATGGEFTCGFRNPPPQTVAIRGTFPAIYFNNEGDKDKILDIVQWGTNKWKTMEYAFEGASNLIVSASDNPDLFEVESLHNMFRRATNLVFTHPINDWNISMITSLAGMFSYTDNFNQDISDWNVSKVVYMGYAFNFAKSFNQPIGRWDVSHGPQMQGMFESTEAFNQDISNWDVSKVSYLRRMFRNSKSFNQDIGDWDVSKVVALDNMFDGSEAFTQDISDWDIRNISSPDFLENMFKDAHLSINNYDKLLIKWSQLDLVDDVVFDAGTSTFCFGGDARESLITNDNWSFIDDDIIDCSFYIKTVSEVSVKSGDTYVIDVNSTYETSSDMQYSITGGTDRDKFTIGQTGLLSFINAPDSKNPTDRNMDNIYRVQVKSEYSTYPVDYQTIKVKVKSKNSDIFPEPISEWKFNGNGLNEVIGMPPANTVGGAIYNTTGGVQGGYAHVSSDSDWISIYSAPEYNLPESFTVEFWFRQFSSQDFLQNLITKGEVGSNDYNFKIHRNPGSVIAGYSYSTDDGSKWNQVSNNNNLTHEKWHHVLYTKNTSGHAYYLDGKRIHHSNFSENAVTNNVNIIIGDSAVNTDFDEVRIYDQSLTEEEALQRYNSYKSNITPIIMYLLN